MATVYLSNGAEKDLKHLPTQTVASLQKEHLRLLSSNPRVGKLLHGPLHGYFSYEFASTGISYRIAYELVKNDVIILMIAKRDNFYKKFTRRVR